MTSLPETKEGFNDFVTTEQGLCTKKLGAGVQMCPEFCDVIYGRPLKQAANCLG